MHNKLGAHTTKKVASPTRESSYDESIQFYQFTDASPDPILITNTKGNIWYVNPAWEKLTGYTSKEVIDKNPRFLHSLKTPSRIYKDLWKLLSEGKNFTTDEICDRKKDGTEYQIHSTFFPIRKDNNNIFYVQIQHDITKKNELERQRDTFIGIASHELKTPISTLSAYMQILEKRLQDDKQNKYFITHIKSQINRLTGLIDDLLHVSRIDSGKLELNLKKLDLESLIKKVVVDSQLTTESHTISYKSDAHVTIIGDELRIEQVIVNLLNNAVKYSQNAHEVIIHLCTDTDKAHAVVSVKDFGMGIVKKDQPNIFQRFYRTKDKEEGRISGFGLGLYISSQIIKKHRGKIWVESTRGKGSTFFFSLPLLVKKNE